MRSAIATLRHQLLRPMSLALIAMIGLTCVLTAHPGGSLGQPGATRVPRVFDTLDQAKAATNLRDGQVVVTQRYSSSHAVGDGSGGEYTYHETGRPTEDGGFFINGAGADDYLELVDRSVAKPEQFGVIYGGGSQTSELQSCFTAAANENVRVECQAGVILTGNVDLGSPLVGSPRGMDATAFWTIIRNDGTVNDGTELVSFNESPAAEGAFYVKNIVFDGNNNNCTNFLAKFNSPGDFSSRYYMENCRSRNGTIGYDINGFIGTILNCFARDNDTSGMDLKTANGVNIIGGEYQGDDSTQGWAIRLLTGRSVVMTGVDVEDADADFSGTNGIMICEHFGSVVLNGVDMEGFGGDDDYAAGRMISVGEFQNDGTTASDNDPNSAVASVVFNGGIYAAGDTPNDTAAFHIYLGNVDRVVANAPALSDTRVYRSEFCTSMAGVFRPQPDDSDAVDYAFQSEAIFVDASGIHSQRSLNFLADPGVDSGSPGWESVLVFGGATHGQETTIARNGSSYRVTRPNGTTVASGIRPQVYEQDKFIADGSRVHFTGYIFVPDFDKYAAQTAFPRVGIRYRDDGAVVDDTHTLGIGLSGDEQWIQLGEWTRFHVWTDVPDDGSVITEMGPYIWPSHTNSLDLLADHSIYVDDMFFGFTPDFMSVMDGNYEIEPDVQQIWRGEMAGVTTYTAASPTFNQYSRIYLDASSNSVNGTLPDHTVPGARVFVYCIDDASGTNESDVTITSHTTGANEHLFFDQDEWAELEWLGSEYTTIETTGSTATD